MKAINIKVFLILVVVVMSIIQCKDDEKKPLENIIIAPGAISNIKIYSGKARVLLTGLLIADPKIAGCSIYWDGRKDSIKVPVVKSEGVDTLRTFINIKEGKHNFEIRTFDKFGKWI